MNKFSAIIVTITALIVSVDAHASIGNPVNRARLARFRGPGHWCDVKVRNSLEFDSPNEEINERNTTCGICGPIYNGDPTIWHTVFMAGANGFRNMTSFEVDSPLYRGDIVATYNKDSVIDVQIEVNALHRGGVHRFNIAKSEFKQDPTQAELNNGILEYENGGFVQDLADGEANNYKYRLKLPAGFTCDRCVLQWQWVAKSTRQ